MVLRSWPSDRCGAVREGFEICRFKISNFTAKKLIYQPHRQSTINPVHHKSKVTIFAPTCGSYTGTILLSSAESQPESICDKNAHI